MQLKMEMNEQILCWFLFHCRLRCSAHQDKSHITNIQARKTISKKAIIHQSTFAARHLCSTLIRSGKAFFLFNHLVFFPITKQCRILRSLIIDCILHRSHYSVIMSSIYYHKFTTISMVSYEFIV